MGVGKLSAPIFWAMDKMYIMKQKGIICGILAAVFYGTNPSGVLPLYAEGVNTSSALFYRFSLAAIMLAMMMIVQHKSFVITKKEAKTLLTLGLLFSASSITYYQSFRYMDAGIASTILFVYPVMVTLIMAACFHEKITFVTIGAIALAMTGILLLYQGDGKTTLSLIGIIFVGISALTYALYIVVINQSSIRMSSIKLTLYVLLICVVSLSIYSLTSPNLHLMLPPSPQAWLCACWLALVPTVLSLVLMAIAVKEAGATPTAIMGALEPLTAVVIGVTLFGEHLTIGLVIGIVMILMAVILIISAKKIHLTVIPGAVRSKVRKAWRWRS